MKLFLTIASVFLFTIETIAAVEPVCVYDHFSSKNPSVSNGAMEKKDMPGMGFILFRSKLSNGVNLEVSAAPEMELASANIIDQNGTTLASANGGIHPAYSNTVFETYYGSAENIYKIKCSLKEVPAMKPTEAK